MCCMIPLYCTKDTKQAILEGSKKEGIPRSNNPLREKRKKQKEMADPWDIYITSPPSGTNWSCPVEADLRQIARHLRHIRADLNRQADLYEWVGRGIAFIAFMLAILNTVLTVPIIKILLPIFVGITAFADLQEWALVSFDTAFELTTIIDAIRAELLLPVCQRIDGIIFLQTIQMDRNAALSEYRAATIWN